MPGFVFYQFLFIRRSLLFLAGLVRAWGLCSGALALLFVGGCTKNQAVLGAKDNPIKLFFVPSVDIKVLEENAKILGVALEQSTGLSFKVSVPANFIAVVEAFGTKRADMAVLNTFGYILAHERYQAQAALTIVRKGARTYRSAFYARANSEIKRLEDAQGKKIAFVDPSSTSGYLLPLKLLKDKKIKPSDTVFAMRHDGVISMIYQGQVDIGAAYYSPPSSTGIEDSRKLVITQYPDVESKIQIIALTDAVPNDPLIFRKDFPQELREKVIQALLKYIKTPDGAKVIENLYGITDLLPAKDSDYDSVREILKTLGRSAQEMIK